MTWHSSRHICLMSFVMRIFMWFFTWWCDVYHTFLFLFLSFLFHQKVLWGWRFKMSLFIHCEIDKHESHSEFIICSQSLTSSALVMMTTPPKAKGAIILFLFTVSEVLPILIYLSWSNGNADLNESHFVCIKSSQIIEFCNPSVVEFRYINIFIVSTTHWLLLRGYNSCIRASVWITSVPHGNISNQVSQYHHFQYITMLCIIFWQIQFNINTQVIPSGSFIFSV